MINHPETVYYQVIKVIVEFEHAFLEFLDSHVMLVEYHLKKRRGTSGTSGNKYLRESRNAQIIWRDLYKMEKAARELVSRDNLIHEPKLLAWDTIIDNEYFKVLQIPEFAVKHMINE